MTDKERIVSLQTWALPFSYSEFYKIQAYCDVQPAFDAIQAAISVAQTADCHMSRMPQEIIDMIKEQVLQNRRVECKAVWSELDSHYRGLCTCRDHRHAAQPDDGPIERRRRYLRCNTHQDTFFPRRTQMIAPSRWNQGATETVATGPLSSNRMEIILNKKLSVSVLCTASIVTGKMAYITKRNVHWNRKSTYRSIVAYLLLSTEYCTGTGADDACATQLERTHESIHDSVSQKSAVNILVRATQDLDIQPYLCPSLFSALTSTRDDEISKQIEGELAKVYPWSSISDGLVSRIQLYMKKRTPSTPKRLSIIDLAREPFDNPHRKEAVLAGVTLSFDKEQNITITREFQKPRTLKKSGRTGPFTRSI